MACVLIECVIHLLLQTAEIKLSGTTPASQRQITAETSGEKVDCQRSSRRPREKLKTKLFT